MSVSKSEIFSFSAESVSIFHCSKSCWKLLSKSVLACFSVVLKLLNSSTMWFSNSFCCVCIVFLKVDKSALVACSNCSISALTVSLYVLKSALICVSKRSCCAVISVLKLLKSFKRSVLNFSLIAFSSSHAANISFLKSAKALFSSSLYSSHAFFSSSSNSVIRFSMYFSKFSISSCTMRVNSIILRFCELSASMQSFSLWHIFPKNS